MRGCIVYACSGTKYAREALVSARRTREVMADCPLVAFADAAAAQELSDSGLFAEVHTIADPAFSFIDKTRIRLPAHYDAGLFLDTDIFLAARVDDVFAILERFDLAVAHEPTRFSMDKGYQRLLDGGAPRGFPEMNTGVIGFRNSPEVAAFFEAWHADNAAREAAGVPPAHDQPAFRTALWDSDLRFYVLPSEFNFRFEMPGFIGGFEGVRVLHGRGRSRKRLARRLVTPRPLPRLHLPLSWPLMSVRKRLRVWRRRRGLTRARLRNLLGRSDALARR